MPTSANPELISDLVAANHILVNEGVLDGFGHVSVRHDQDPQRFLIARSMAPALVAADDIVSCDMDGTVHDARGRRSYLERFIHSAIYRARPDVMAVVHSHSPSVIPFGVTGARLRPICHMSGFLGAEVPVFEIRRSADENTDMLISNQALGMALAAVLGPNTVALMRGHGSIAVGQSIQQVVYRAIYTESNARLQMQAMQLGEVRFLSEGEAKASTTTNDTQLSRPWEVWKRRASGQSI